MGYTTDFDGTLMFSRDITVPCLREVQEWLGCDAREIEPSVDHGWHYMQFKITGDMDGLEWDGCEKFYGAVEAVNWLVAKVREKFPHFGLVGELSAQGEDAADRWILRMQDGAAVRINNPPAGTRVSCPDCGADFYFGGEQIND